MIVKFVIAPGTQAHLGQTPRAAFDEKGKLQLSHERWRAFYDAESGDEFIRRFGLELTRDNFWHLEKPDA